MAEKIKEVEFDPNFSYEWFSYGWPRRAIILDKESSIAVREFGKAKWEAEMAAIRAKMAEEKKILAQTVPGIEELEAAYAADADYRAAFQAAMEDEYNDGVDMPTPPTANIEELRAKYPRADLYLKANSYAGAENYLKAAAGEKAKTILSTGGSYDEAKDVLDNWVKDVDID